MIQKRLGPPPLTAAQFDACRPYLRLSARVLAAAENVLVWNATQSSIARHLGLHRQAVHRACGLVLKVSRDLAGSAHTDTLASTGRVTDEGDHERAADSGGQEGSRSTGSILAGVE